MASVKGFVKSLECPCFLCGTLKNKSGTGMQALTADALDTLSEMLTSPGLETITQAWLVPDGVVLKQNQQTLILGIIALVQYRQRG